MLINVHLRFEFEFEFAFVDLFHRVGNLIKSSSYLYFVESRTNLLTYQLGSRN
jgi:hypothetical protein